MKKTWNCEATDVRSVPSPRSNRRLRSWSLAGLSALALCAWPASSQAQQTATGFSVNRYEPPERGSDWLVGDSLDLRGKLRTVEGITSDYSYRPLVNLNPDGSVRASIVRNFYAIHLGGTIVGNDRYRIGLEIPIVAYAFGHTGADRGIVYPAPNADAGVGDVRLTGDVRLVGEYGDALTLVAGLQGWIPTGSKEAYMGDGKLRLMPRVLAAGELGIFAYAAKLGVLYRARTDDYGDSELGTEIVYQASAGLKFADKKLLIGPEFFGASVANQFFKSHATPLEAQLSATYMVTDKLRVGASAGGGFTAGFGTPAFRTLAVIDWVPKEKPSDRDQDGIPDTEDACPDKAGPHTDDPKTNGCPPPPSDRDHDGILDKDDACPDVAGVASSDPKKNGCPPPSDRDKDGIVDDLDACPDDPGPATDDPKTTGCPDKDGDKIVDKFDACPDKPGVKTDDPKTNGCPPAPVDPDRDKDGIPNEQDACPDQPGKPNADPKKNGCPQVFIQGSQIVIVEQVRFAPGSAAIVPGKESEGVLQGVLTVMKGHPEIKRIRVEGHTDNQGGAAYNRALSGSRAAAVVAWLVKNGIDKDRLTSAGLGPDRPIADNKDEAGRKQNRRVEFHIAEGEK